MTPLEKLGMWGSVASLVGVVFNIISLFSATGHQAITHQQNVQVEGNNGSLTIVQGDGNTVGGRIPDAQPHWRLARLMPLLIWGSALIGFVILWFMAHKPRELQDSQQTIHPISDNKGQIVVVQGSHNKIEAIISTQQGITPATLNMIVARYEETITNRDIQLKAIIYDKEREISELRNGLTRVQHAAEAGDTKATAALKSARESGNLDQVQSALVTIAERVDTNIEGNSNRLVVISREIARIALMRGDYDEALNRLQYILTAEPNDVISLSYRAQLYMMRNDLEEAGKIYQQITEISPPDPEAQCVALGNIANILRIKGNIEDAEKTHQQVLAIAQKENLNLITAMAHLNLGMIHKEQKLIDQAEVEMQAAIKGFETLATPADLSMALCSLARLYIEENRTDDALALVTRAKSVKQINSLPLGLAYCYGTEGAIFMERSEYGLASNAYEEELKIHKHLKNEGEIARTQLILAGAYYHNSNYVKAAEYFREVMSSPKNDEDAMSYYLFGNALSQIGGLDDAHQQYMKCLSISVDKNDLSTQLLCHRSLAALYNKTGDANDAIKSIKSALKISQQLGDKKEISVDKMELARTHAIIDQLDEALSPAQEVVDGLTDNDDPGFAAAAHTLLGEILRMKHDYTGAIEHLGAAADLYKMAGNSYMGAMNINKLASSLMSIGELDLAEKASNDALTIGRFTKDDENCAISLGNLASIYYSRDEDYEAAEVTALQAVELNEKLKRVSGLVVNYVTLSELYSAKGDVSKAQEYRELIKALPKAEITKLSDWKHIEKWLEGGGAAP